MFVSGRLLAFACFSDTISLITLCQDAYPPSHYVKMHIYMRHMLIGLRRMKGVVQGAWVSLYDLRHSGEDFLSYVFSWGLSISIQYTDLIHLDLNKGVRYSISLTLETNLAFKLIHLQLLLHSHTNYNCNYVCGWYTSHISQARDHKQH